MAIFEMISLELNHIKSFRIILFVHDDNTVIISDFITQINKKKAKQVQQSKKK